MLPLLSTLTIIALSLGNAIGLCSMETAVDSYLYARYVETPKVDTSGDFEGKDAAAAARLGMTVEQYAIWGMSWDLRMRLYNLIRAGDAEGIFIGITSGYRDDWRQAHTQGKTRNRPGHSFHGGSLVGGWGHGLAVDLVALAPTRELALKEDPRTWAFIDRVGQKLGLGRPYGDRDAPHVAPLSSREFAVAAAKRHAHELALMAKRRRHSKHHVAHRHRRKRVHVASS